jgi:hypothetical protein
MAGNNIKFLCKSQGRKPGQLSLKAGNLAKQMILANNHIFAGNRIHGMMAPPDSHLIGICDTCN